MRGAGLRCLPILGLLVACGEPVDDVVRQGQTLLEEGRVAEARELAHQAAARDPDHLEARLLQARLDQSEGGLEAALVAFQAIVGEEPNHLDAWLGAAEVQLRMTRPAAALAAADEVLRIQADNLDGLALRASALLQLGRHDEALETAGAALTIEPSHELAALVAARVHADRGQSAAGVGPLERAIEANPQDLRLRIYLAELQARIGDHARAVATLEEIVAQAPAVAEHRMRLAIYHLTIGALDRAEAVLRDGVRDHPDVPDMRAALATFLAARHGTGATEALLEEAAIKEAATAELLFALGRSWQRDGRLAEAAEAYRQAAAGAGTSQVGLEARWQLVALDLKDGRKVEAERLLDEILAIDPEDEEALLTRAELALERGDPEVAIADARRLRGARPGAPRVHVLLARAYAAKGEWLQATTMISIAVEKSPKDPELRLELAKLLLQSGALPEAERELVFVLKNQNDHFGALRMLAELELRRERWSAASEIGERLIASRPDQPHGHVVLGRAARGEGRPSAALDAYRRAFQLAPGSSRILLELVQVQIEQERFDDARAVVEAALTRRSDRPEVHGLLADVLVAAGREDEAIAAYRRGLAATGSDETLAFVLAKLHERRGELDEAAVLYEGVLTRNPESVAAAASLAALGIDTGPTAAAAEPTGAAR